MGNLLDRDAPSHNLWRQMMELEETPTERKMIGRSEYERVVAMIEEGCPNGSDLEEFEIIEDKPEPSSRTL
jgi:hypothetical protein